MWQQHIFCINWFIFGIKGNSAIYKKKNNTTETSEIRLFSLGGRQTRAAIHLQESRAAGCWDDWIDTFTGSPYESAPEVSSRKWPEQEHTVVWTVMDQYLKAVIDDKPTSTDYRMQIEKTLSSDQVSSGPSTRSCDELSLQIKLVQFFKLQGYVERWGMCLFQTLALNLFLFFCVTCLVNSIDCI